jgi:hypothetical protein
MIQRHLDEEDNNIITIWFDAWRYENEEFSALVPLVRTIILHLEEYVKKLESEKNPKAALIKNLVNKFKKVVFNFHIQFFHNPINEILNWTSVYEWMNVGDMG